VDALSGARPRRSRCSRSTRRGSHRRRPRFRWGGQPSVATSLGHARAAPTTSTAGGGHTLARHGPLVSLHRGLSRPPARAGSRGHLGSPSPKRAELVPLPVRPRQGRSLRRGHVHNADPQVTNPIRTPARDNHEPDQGHQATRLRVPELQQLSAPAPPPLRRPMADSPGRINTTPSTTHQRVEPNIVVPPVEHLVRDSCRMRAHEFVRSS
jgi:hypothetical protein